MVKGNTRQVVVVKASADKPFEQAIFLLREDVLEKSGIGERELLDQARRAADSYLTERKQKRKRGLPPIAWMLLGAAPILIAWLAVGLLFR